MAVRETVDGKKVKIAPAEALELLAGVSRLVAMRGRSVTAVDLKSDRPDDDTLLGLMIGRTGHLRAPTIRVGKTLLIGFNAEVYQQMLGG